VTAAHYTSMGCVPASAALSVVVRRLFRTRSISCRFEGLFSLSTYKNHPLTTARDLTSSITETVDGMLILGDLCVLTGLFQNHFNSLVNKTITLGTFRLLSFRALMVYSPKKIDRLLSTGKRGKSNRLH